MIETVALCALLFSSPPPPLANMGGLGGDDDKRVDVPVAPEIFQATVTDVTLTDTPLDEFSVDGYTHVAGSLGAGTIAIRFEEIARVDLEPGEKGKSVALITLKNGQVKKIVVDNKVPLYGKTGFGNFRILVKDVKRVVITGGPIKRNGDKEKPRTAGGAATPAPKSAP
ncbi:MAG TPA: hypothetical protein VMV18_14390 [bacterium]|nr:hypothetical protein [bacterium]